jgi:hypothetical protein
MATDFAADIAAVQAVAAVPRILEVVCRPTGMGFAAVARVTEERWVLLCAFLRVLFRKHFRSIVGAGSQSCDRGTSRQFS